MGRDSAVQTVFLGWEEMPLKAATRWLLKDGEDLSQVVVALPGARSGRLLLDALALSAGKQLRPPKIVTAGTLSDVLLELDGVPAGRLARTLAWSRALRGLSEGELLRIAAQPPAQDDLNAWWQLAEEVRGLFGEVAAEGLKFADVAENKTLLDEGVSREGERQRWHALAAAQTAMAAELERASLCDPHLGRLQAISEGRAASIAHVVLIGVVEMNKLLRDALELSSANCTALVFAPLELESSFDTLGCLLAQPWVAREGSLTLEQWHVADRPADQARLARGEIASWKGEYSAEQISIGLGNPEAGPFVKRCLAQEGVVVRDATGESPADSPPAKLLSLLGRFLDSERFLDFTNLLRHADFEAAVRSRQMDVDPIATADKYFNAHLPAVIDGTWLANRRDKRDCKLRDAMAQVWQASERVLGELWSARARTDGHCVGRLRNFLETLYAEQTFELADDAERKNFEALQAIGKAISEVEDLPDAFQPNCSLPQLLQLLGRALRAGYLAPASAKDNEPTIEMLGWLELALDNAPALVVLGFEEGHVPESVRGDAYLPNRLRSDLGLLDDEQRLARDIYASELLLHSRERVAFISGRRSLVGDPLLASRIVFHCPPADLPTRVRRFITGDELPEPRERDENMSVELPGSAAGFKLKTISVTDFKTYLKSPYEYFLRKVARAQSIDDRSRELDALQFGIVGHEAVERFGRDKRARDSQDADEIAKHLRGTLEDLGRELFGSRPLPAVRLQLQQLRFRLDQFAIEQAQHRRAGWRILEVEWTPDGGGVPFRVDDEDVELRGKIDRIDYHETLKQYAVWDYKTGNSVKKPATAHRKQDGQWRDLQLPLYCWLVQELTGDRPPDKLGYIALGQKLGSIGFMDMPRDWGGTVKGGTKFDCFEDGIEDAQEAAQEVIRKIRKCEFFTAEGYNPSQDDPILRAIGNLDLVEESEDESEEQSA